MSNYPQLFLNSKQAKYFDGRHPWVLQRSIVEPTVELEAGQVVELIQPNGSWIGRGIYNPNSRIRVRLYQWDRELKLDVGWLQTEIDRAIDLRLTWMRTHGQLDAVRLVNSEGDGLSGLIVDRFSDYIVVQLTSWAMLQWRDEIVQWLANRLQPKGIYVAMEPATAKQEGAEQIGEWQFGTGPESAVEIEEGGVQLKIDLDGGQKTGYYLDQRANRIAAANWFHDGSLLDVCCYQGGFSLAALKSNSKLSVLAVDSSEKALATARENMLRNGLEQFEFQKADCFSFLQKAADEGRQFDNIVLDPPRMASTRHQITPALRAYHRLNLSAVRLLRPGGMLVTCSCSGRVSREEFWGVLSSVAKRSRRNIQVIEARGADCDHPIDVNCRESDYLKCFICRVA